MDYSGKSPEELVVELNKLSAELASTKAMFTNEINTRERIEKDLRRHEERLRFASEGLAIGIWDWDIPSNKVFYSKRWKQMLGYDEHEIGITSEEWSNRVHPQDLPKLMALVDANINNQTNNYSCDCRMRCKDGSYKWILTEGSVVVRNEKGEAVRIVGSHKDISTRKKLEYDLGERLKELECHNRISQLTGEHEMTVESFLSQIPQILTQSWQFPEHAQACITVYGKAYCSKGFEPSPARMEQSILIGGKQVGDILICYHTENWDHAEPLFLHEEEILIAGVAIRIANFIESKQKDETIHQNEIRYQNLIENISDVVFEVDSLGRLTYVSPVVDRLLGFKPEQVRGLHLTDLLNVEGAYLEFRFNKLKEQHQVENEYHLTHADGSDRWVRVSTKAMFNNGVFEGGSGTVVDITEKKLIELELQKSNTIYQSIINASPDTITITDLKGNVRFSSPSALKTFGFSGMDELTGKNILDFLLPEYHPKATNTILDMLNGQMRGAEEYRAQKKDGEVIDIEVNAEIIRNENDKPMQFLFVTRDISDRKRSAEQLQKSETAYKHLVETVNDAIYEVSNEGTVRFVSPAIERILGYTPEELTGKNFFGYMHPDDRQMLVQALQNLGKQDYSFLEYRYYNKKGEIRWVRSSSKPVYENGVLVGGTGVLIDIHDRKMAEEELRKLSRAVEQSPVSIVITNLKGEIEYANPKACETTGYTTNELIHQNPRVLKSGETASDEYGVLWQTITSGKQWHGIFHNKRKNGELYWESSSISPITDSDGTITHFLAVKEDITDQKITEEALLQSEERLSQIAEQSHTVIWEVDATGLYTYVSPVAQKVWGYRPDQLVGKVHFYDLHPLENRDDFKIKALDGFANKLKFNEFINPMVKPSGQTIWVSTNGVPILDKNGNLLGYRGADNDITIRMEWQEQLKQQNERLNALVSAIPDLIFVIDENGTYLEYVGADSTLLLDEPHKLIGRNLADFFSPEDTIKHLEQIKECINHQQLITYEYSIGLKNNTASFEARIAPYGANKVLTFVRDITLKKQKDQEIKKLSLAIEQSPVSIVITDLNANIEYINPAFIESTGYNRNELLGANTKILKSGKHTTEEYKMLWDTITQGDEWHGELVNKRKNGELYWESTSITPVYDETGTITNYLAVKQDITERKQSEEQIKELNASLEIKIAERTSQLASTNKNLLIEIDERKRIEKALIQSEKNYRDVVENIKEVIFQTDTNGNWIFLNAAWHEITGFEVEDSLGKLFLDYVHPDDRERNNELFRPLVNREKEYCKHEIRYLTKDGGFRWIEVFARLGIGLNNEMLGTFGTLQDITDRKRAEEFEAEMLRLSPKLTGIPLAEIDSALKLALTQIGHFLNADRAYVFEFDEQMTTMSNTHEWCNNHIAPEIANLQHIPCHLLPRWMETIRRHQNILIPSVADLPESWRLEKEILEPQGIQSLLVMPLLSENKVIGFAGLDSVNSQREFNDSEINTLKVWSSMIASLIKNQRSEKLLEQTRANFENFFNSIDDFIWILDNNGNVIHANNTAINRLGIELADIYNKPILSVHPSDRSKEVIEIVQKMLEGKLDVCTVPLVSQSGLQIPVETKVKPGFWNGRPVIFGISKDLSQIKLSEQKFSSAFHANSAMMAISNFESGEYIDVNNAFLETLGFTSDEVIGQTNQSLSLFPNKGLRHEIIQMLESGIAVQKLEISMRTKSGTLKTGLLSAESIYVGNIHCLLTVTIDITSRKMAEEELVKARLEAEKANTAKSEFLSRMSHELRTPMNSILGFAQLLEMGELTPSQKKGVSHIMRSGKHLLELINEVLDISRIEAGRLHLSLEPVQIKGIVSEIISAASPFARAKHITVSFSEAPANELFVKSDRQRLKQVLINLLNNAIKYNRPGGSVTVSAAQLSADGQSGNRIRILVEDNGIGMSPDDLKKLFTPFERVGAEKTQVEGTGLGLSVVKKLMEAMGGHVGVKSQLNTGSTFWIDIEQSASPLDQLTANTIDDTVTPGLHHKKGKILYIEDNLSNVDLVSQILHTQHTNIDLIADAYGKNAIPLALKHKPNLILLDLDLPDIHGSEVLTLLKNNRELASTPVVVVSADAMAKQLEKLLANGANYYLTKPFDIKEFLKIIDEFIK